jgi:hypothetical protein
VPPLSITPRIRRAEVDPVTALALAAKAIAEMITEIVRGQPPEVRKQAWERSSSG